MGVSYWHDRFHFHGCPLHDYCVLPATYLLLFVTYCVVTLIFESVLPTLAVDLELVTMFANTA
eukprot:4794867-Amphidinium_carterae.2